MTISRCVPKTVMRDHLSGLVVDSVPFMFCFSPTALSPPHMTGDGFYEAVIAHPDGNRVELVECDLLKTACRSLYRVVYVSRD